MLCCSREGTNPHLHQQPALRTPQLQEAGLDGSEVDEKELGLRQSTHQIVRLSTVPNAFTVVYCFGYS